jgi:hypothetical protein
MTLHIIKLCVGCDSIEDLREWQEERLAEKRRKGEKPVLAHVTRSMPKRREEVLDGGSLYWVIKGYVRVRQRILDLEQRIDENGVPCCAIVRDTPLVPTRLMAHRPFQGWRYLDPADAPPDIGTRGLAEAMPGWEPEPPPELLEKLKELGLI